MPLPRLSRQLGAALATLAAAGCARRALPSGMARGGLVRVYALELPGELAPAARARITGEAAVAIGMRLEALRVCRCDVRVVGDAVVAVGFPPLANADYFAAQESLRVRGLLEFGEVTDGAGLASLEDAWLDRFAVRRAVDHAYGARAGQRDALQLEGDSVEALRNAVANLPPGVLPPGTAVRLTLGAAGGPDGRPATAPRALVVRLEPGAANRFIRAARAGQGADTREPHVEITLDPAGREWLAALTRRLVGRKLAIVFDGVVQSAPLVMEPITGGNLQLTLGGGALPTMQAEAARIAAVLQTRPLPAALREQAVWQWTPRPGRDWWTQP